MPELNSSSVNSFIEAVKNGAEESASSFSRTFDATVTLEPKKGGKYSELSANLNEKGLAILLKVGTRGIAILIPSSAGLIPNWCDAPDATGKSKLATFAQEWAMNLAPEDFFPDDQSAAVLQSLSQGLARADMDLDAGYVEIALGKTDGTSASAYIVWALSAPDKLLEEPQPVVEEIPQAPPIGNAPPTFSSSADPFANAPFGTPNFAGAGMPLQHRRLEDLPGYTRSALKVKVPVATILARARKPIKTILELGVGSIIQFEKSCEEMLEIEVGQSIVIAAAEAVKVGDKFGFRISTVVLPEERFRRVEVRREGEYRAKTESPQIIGKAPIKLFSKRMK